MCLRCVNFENYCFAIFYDVTPRTTATDVYIESVARLNCSMSELAKKGWREQGMSSDGAMRNKS